MIADSSSEVSIPYCLGDCGKAPSAGLRVASLFSGGGGSCIGYRLAGCRVLLSVDIDPNMSRQVAANSLADSCLVADVRDPSVGEALRDLRPLDVLDGSPPCSSFSTAGHREAAWGKKHRFREGQVAQILDDLPLHFVRRVHDVQPRFAVMENVMGLTAGKARGFLREILSGLFRAGYETQTLRIDASAFGVPQARERLFLIARRRDLGLPALSIRGNRRKMSAAWALSGLPPPAPGQVRHLTEWMAQAWKRTRPGDPLVRDIERRLRRRSVRDFYKLHPDRPSPCLSANLDGHTHWDSPRWLTWPERRRLAGFPDDYRVESENLGKRIVGYSVAPLVTREIARAIRERLQR